MCTDNNDTALFLHAINLSEVALSYGMGLLGLLVTVIGCKILPKSGIQYFCVYLHIDVSHNALDGFTPFTEFVCLHLSYSTLLLNCFRIQSEKIAIVDWPCYIP